MKRILLLLLSIGLFMNVSTSAAEKPDYEKYGLIAIAVVKANHPNEDVVEYKYEGRQKVTGTEVLDTFTFHVKENGKPVEVKVKIKHDLNNSKLLNITVQEQQLG